MPDTPRVPELEPTPAVDGQEFYQITRAQNRREKMWAIGGIVFGLVAGGGGALAVNVLYDSNTRASTPATAPSISEITATTTLDGLPTSTTIVVMTTEVDSTVAVTSSEAPTTELVLPIGAVAYVVQPGDSLLSIAGKCGNSVTSEYLQSLNPKLAKQTDPTHIEFGMNLILPPECKDIFQVDEPSTSQADTTSTTETTVAEQVTTTSAVPDTTTSTVPDTTTTTLPRPNDGYLKDPDCTAKGGVPTQFLVGETLIQKLKTLGLTDKDIYPALRTSMTEDFHLIDINTAGLECVPTVATVQAYTTGGAGK